MRTIEIKPYELPAGRTAFAAITQLNTGKTAYKIAYNAQEFRRADKIFQDEAQRILNECSWQWEGKPIYGCAHEQFNPALYRGPRPDEHPEEDYIYSEDGNYYRCRYGVITKLGMMVVFNANGQSNVCLKSPDVYRERMMELEQNTISVNVLPVKQSELEEIDGLTAASVWLPMIEMED